MLNWKSGKVKVKMSESSDKELSARITGKFAVHKSVNIKTPNKWAVTHVPTGLLLTELDKRAACVDLVEDLSKEIFGFTYMSADRLKNHAAKIVNVISAFQPE